MAFPAKISIPRKVHDLLGKMSFPGPEWMSHDEKEVTILRSPVKKQWAEFLTSFTRVREEEENKIDRRRGDRKRFSSLCDEFIRSVEANIEKFRKLESCPTCPEQGAFSERDGKDTIQFQCRSCKTIWGTELCSKGHRYPSLLPGGKPPDPAGDIDNPVAWLDQRYGGDLLSDLDLSGKGEFCCPGCDQAQQLDDLIDPLRDGDGVS
jgi:hypothetical protein